jgi:branched-chain amino acid transport system permease protein
LFVVVAAVVGGVGTIYGSVVGVIVLTIVAEAVRGYGEVNEVIYGVVLLVILVLVPGGLVSIVATLIKRTESVVAKNSRRNPR